LGLMLQLHYVAIGYLVLLLAAAWLARRGVCARHVIAACCAFALPLLPFALYELHPSVRLRDVGFLLDQAATGSRFDASAWNLLWTLAGNGGAAGLGGANLDGLRDALGRWSSLGLVGDALLGGGLIVGMMDGIRGRLI